ncbi:GNAT family N-acetyltransferase [Kitasatospora sp. NPDC096128]|uniref:GNAT family N-acetyltransferase n=1 Tax=Kitasatospora sp. NPDC096128 TaxID=3155547 RepID=UPI0033216B69
MTTPLNSVALPPGVCSVASAAELPRADWDGLTGADDLFLSTRWLDVVERTAGVPMRYLWVERDGALVAGLATALATRDAPWLLGRTDAVLRRAAASDFPDAADLLAEVQDADALLPSLLAGGRQLGNTRVLHGPHSRPEDLAALVGAAETLAREAGAASLAFLFVADRDRPLADLLARRGYTSFTSGRYATLTVPPTGFEGYLAAFSGRRRSIKAERRRIGAAGVTVAAEPLSTDVLPRLAELEAELIAKYGIPWSADRSLNLIGRTAERFGDDAFAVLARAEGEIRGFSLVLRHHGAWYARHSGFDYAFQRRTGTALYFEVGYYRLIEEAAAAGVGTIHYGFGSDATKASRGCAIADQRCHLLRIRTNRP